MKKELQHGASELLFLKIIFRSVLLNEGKNENIRFNSVIQTHIVCRVRKVALSPVIIQNCTTPSLIPNLYYLKLISDGFV